MLLRRYVRPAEPCGSRPDNARSGDGNDKYPKSIENCDTGTADAGSDVPDTCHLNTDSRTPNYSECIDFLKFEKFKNAFI